MKDIKLFEGYAATNPLEEVAVLRADLLSNNSANYKKKALDAFVKAHNEDAAVMNVLNMIFDSEKFLLTSKIFDMPASMREDEGVTTASNEEIAKALAGLKDPNLSTSTKKSELRALHSNLSKGAAEVLECILDKDLKCGVSSSAYKEFIKSDATLGVSLANKYFEKQKKVNFEKDTWYMSRKLDGVV